MTAEDKILFQNLLMKAVDNELSSVEKKTFEHFIKNDAECKNEWEEFSKLNKLTGGIQMKLPEQEKWEQYWSHIYNRLERRIGWILFSIGLIILMATGGFYAIHGFLSNPLVPLPEKVGLAAFFLKNRSAGAVWIIRRRIYFDTPMRQTLSRRPYDTL